MTNIFPEFDLLPWLVRQFKMTDLEFVRKASSDPFIPLITSVPSIFSEQEGKAYIERQWARYKKQEGYSFAIAEKETDEAIGSVYVGLRNIEEGRATIGYWILEDYRGKGVAKAVLIEISRWAQSELGIPRLELYVEPWNTGSLKTAEAAGYQQEGLMRSWQKVGDKRKDMIMMSLIS